MMACWRSEEEGEEIDLMRAPLHQRRGGGGWMAVLVRCDDDEVCGGVECGMWGDVDISKSKHGTRVRCGDLRVKIECNSWLHELFLGSTPDNSMVHPSFYLPSIILSILLSIHHFMVWHHCLKPSNPCYRDI